MPSGPVSVTSLTVGTARQTSTNVSLDGGLVAGSTSLMFGGSGKTILTRPFWRRLLKSVGALAVGPEIVRVDRPEQRIVGPRIPSAPPLEELEPRLDARRRQLELVGRHVAVGARAPVRAQPVQAAVEERAEAADDGVARLAAAVGVLRRSTRGAGLRRRR